MTTNKLQGIEMYMEIAVWADGTWTEVEYLDEYSHMSDDFIVVIKPESNTQDIEDFVFESIHGKHTEMPEYITF